MDGYDAPSPAVHDKRVVIVPFPHPRIITGGYAGRAAVIARARPTDRAAVPSRERDDLRLLSLRLGARHTETLEWLFRAPGIHVCDLAALLGVQLRSTDRYLSDLNRHDLLGGVAQEVSHSRHGAWASHPADAEDSFSHLSFAPMSCMALSTSGHRLVTMLHSLGARSQLARRGHQ